MKIFKCNDIQSIFLLIIFNEFFLNPYLTGEIIMQMNLILSEGYRKEGILMMKKLPIPAEFSHSVSYHSFSLLSSR